MIPLSREAHSTYYYLAMFTCILFMLSSSSIELVPWGVPCSSFYQPRSQTRLSGSSTAEHDVVQLGGALRSTSPHSIALHNTYHFDATMRHLCSISLLTDMAHRLFCIKQNHSAASPA